MAFRAVGKVVTVAASDSAWGRLIEVKLANWLLKETREKEKTESLLDKESGMTKEPASLLGPEEPEEECLCEETSLVGVGTRS
jgi:hypothetical protein